jgi:hypothetical protein
MMPWIDVAIRVFLVGISLFNVGLSVLLIYRHAALHRVTMLLQLICVQAFTLREWPFEVSRALRMRVDISPEPDFDWIDEEIERMKARR